MEDPKITIEFENGNGDTLCAIQIDKNLKVVEFQDCSLADICGDYIFNTDNQLVRIQLDDII